jgi:hypothetical protein
MPDVRELLERESQTVDLERGHFERLTRRRDRKRRNRQIGAGALALVVSLLAVAALVRAVRPEVVPGSSIAPTPSPVYATTTPSTAPPGFGLPTSTVHAGQLDPGTYTYLDVGGQGFNVRFTVPAGWTWNGRYLSKGGVGPPDGAAIFFFGGRVQVYADPCHWTGGGHSAPMTGRRVDRLMAALTAQPMRYVTAPVDRPANVPGLANRWPGMAVELTVPDNVNFATCDRGQFRSWGPENNARIHQGPGQRDLVWAVDVEGAAIRGTGVFPPGGLIIDAASFPGTPAEVMSEIEAILRSVAVGHWG